jgi:two-component system OmpR family response regulator
MDVMLPNTDGFTLCRELRRQGVTTPVLMITALDTIHDRVTGLDSGADDYLAKPFSFAELLARLRALARRPRDVQMPVLTVGTLRLDPAARTVHRGDLPIELTRKEFALLEVLMRRPGEAVSRFDLLESAWDDSYDNRSNVVDVYIGYLRQKLDRPFGTDNIETVRGFGYRLRTEETA